jgi:hypothetical protein
MSSRQKEAAKIARLARKREAAELLAKARGAADLPQIDTAELVCGVSRTLLRSWEDPDDDAHVVPVDALMAPELAPHAVRLLAARCGMVAVELPAIEDGSEVDMLHHITEIQRETSEALAAALGAVNAKHRSPADTARICREMWEAIEAIVRCHTAMERTPHDYVPTAPGASDIPRIGRKS